MKSKINPKTQTEEQLSHTRRNRQAESALTPIFAAAHNNASENATPAGSGFNISSVPANSTLAREGDEEGGFFSTVWNSITNNAVSGGLGLVDELGKGAAAGSRLSQAGGVAGKIAPWLGPLGLISGGTAIHDTATKEGNWGLTDTSDTLFNLLGMGSSAVATTGLLGSGLTAAGATGAGGALTGAAAAAGPAAAVMGAGAGGYAAGRLLDEGVGGLMNLTGASDMLDSLRGVSRPEGQHGDYSLSGMGADAMTGMDEGAVAALRGLGILDESKPAYTQTLGWQLAEILPSWMQ